MRITIEADSPAATILNEYLIDDRYETNIYIDHYPTPADPETGWLAGYEVSQVKVQLLRIYDSEGDLVLFTKEEKAKIEETLETNLEITII